MSLRIIPPPNDGDAAGSAVLSSNLPEQSWIRVGKRECPSLHSFKNKAGRLLWGITWVTAFRTSPRVFYSWRRLLLRLFGAKIGRNARIWPSVRVWAPWNLDVGEEASISHNVDCYCVDRITIGSHATVSQYAHLCAASHDISDPNMRLTMAPVTVADQAWVCAGAFVGPGVAVAEGAVVGARAVVRRDVEAWTVVAGNPAKFIRQRELRIEQ